MKHTSSVPIEVLPSTLLVSWVYTCSTHYITFLSDVTCVVLGQLATLTMHFTLASDSSNTSKEYILHSPDVQVYTQVHVCILGITKRLFAMVGFFQVRLKGQTEGKPGTHNVKYKTMSIYLILVFIEAVITPLATEVVLASRLHRSQKTYMLTHLRTNALTPLPSPHFSTCIAENQAVGSCEWSNIVTPTYMALSHCGFSQWIIPCNKSCLEDNPFPIFWTDTFCNEMALGPSS